METSGLAEASLRARGTNLFLGKIDRINSLESMHASICTSVLGYSWKGELKNISDCGLEFIQRYP